jgi:hypothetical protein
MSMVSTSPSKYIDWQMRLKSNTGNCVAHKKHTSLTKTNIGLGQKGRERYSKQMDPQIRHVCLYLYLIK